MRRLAITALVGCPPHRTRLSDTRQSAANLRTKLSWTSPIHLGTLKTQEPIKLSDNGAKERTESQRARRTQRERIEISDRKMLEAAKDIILEVGASKLTLKEVGERAGYSRAMAGYRFGDKEGLFEALSLKTQREWSGLINEAVRGKRGLAALVASIDAYKRYVIRNSRSHQATMTLRYEALANNSNIKEHVATTHKN